MSIKDQHRKHAPKMSLKSFARITPPRRKELGYGDPAVAARWLERKAQQRRSSAARRANKGHHDIHVMATNRSEYRASGLRSAVRS